jgi:hypothetical protein
MTDRENSPAFAALPRSARKVFAAIERAIGDGSSASVSLRELPAGSPHRPEGGVAILEAARPYRPVEIEPGPRPVKSPNFGHLASDTTMLNDRLDDLLFAE